MAPQGGSLGRQEGEVEWLTLNPPAGGLSCPITDRSTGPLLGERPAPSHCAPRLCHGWGPIPGEKSAQVSQKRGNPQAVPGWGAAAGLHAGTGHPGGRGEASRAVHI